MAEGEPNKFKVVESRGRDKIAELLDDLTNADNSLTTASSTDAQSCHVLLSKQYYNTEEQLSGMIGKQYQYVLASKSREGVSTVYALTEDAPTSDLPIELPSDASLLFTIMSEDAEKFGWSKMPAVIVQGALPLDEQGMTNLEFVGLPLTPAHSDKAAAEQLEDLLRSCPYPDDKTYYVRGRYYLILGSCLADVDAAFASIVKRVLQGRRFSRTSFEDNPLMNIGAGLGTVFRRLSSMLQRSRSDPVPSESGTMSPTALSMGLSMSQPTSPPAEMNNIFKKPCRASNEFHRIPQFQTGLRPW